MENQVRYVEVNAANVEQERFFCYKSKPKTPGYQNKLGWLQARFAEGMKMHIAYEGKRSVGFIEYIPAEYGWRAVQAEGYLLIHCLWVVGSGKGKGHASRLLQMCVDDAQAQGKRGVVMVSSSGNWLAGKKIFVRSGFEEVGAAPPSFQLLVKRFDNSAPLPTFPDNWAARQAAYGPGMSIIHSAQCPYIPDANGIFPKVAAERGIAARLVPMESAAQVQDCAPTAYGVYSVVLDGKLLSYTYLTEKQLHAALDKLA